MTTEQRPKLTGEVVTVSYVANPAVGHGRFRLENPRAAAVTAAVESTWLELGQRRQTLTGVTVFDLQKDRMVNPQSLEVAAGAVLVFLVGFPRVAYEPRFGETGAVGLRLRVNGAQLQAQSPIKFERRIPYRS